MHLGRLQIFYHAAETLSFSQAALRLNVTQPAVSAQIRTLEENLGVKLFARLGKRIVLTEAGQTLLGYTRRIFRLRDEAEKVISEMRMVRRGTLKVGTTKTYAGHIMPPLLARFQTAFPQVAVVLNEGSSLEVVKSLKSLAVEVAVIAFPGPVKRIQYKFLKQEDLVLIVHPRHELAEAKNVPIKRLAEEHLVMREKGSGTRRVVLDLFRRHRASPKIVFETSNAEVIKEQVAAGVGIAWLTRSSVQGAIDMGRLAPVFHQGGGLKLEINTAVLEGHELSQPARAFLDMLAES